MARVIFSSSLEGGGHIIFYESCIKMSLWLTFLNAVYMECFGIDTQRYIWWSKKISLVPLLTTGTCLLYDLLTTYLQTVNERNNRTGGEAQTCLTSHFRLRRATFTEDCREEPRRGN